MPRCRIRARYEQLSEFERGRISGLKEAGWANLRISRHMDRSNAVIRCWQERKNMESVLLLIMCALILTMTAILIIFVLKIILRLLFERTWDSPFICLQHNSPNIQIYIARTPGQHPYFRILEEYEQKMDDNNCKVEIGHTPS
ncbi:UNVERIFIED_CONTAM: hypothetical protein NCL1_13003 [Trichonephila clavipes]